MSEVSLEKKQSFFEHLIELRSCLIKAFIGWIIASVIVYIYTDEIIEFLINPLKPYLLESKVFFRGITEVFINQFKIALILGFILGSPYIIYQFWSFIAPGLYPYEKRLVKLAFFFSSFSFLIGSLVGYYLFLPFLLKFFYSFGSQFLIFKPYLKEYVNFLLKILILFGILFQIPSCVFLINKMGIIDLHQLKKGRSYAILLSFLIASVVTTGSDPIYLLIIALPLTILYEVGILLIEITSFRRV